MTLATNPDYPIEALLAQASRRSKRNKRGCFSGRHIQAILGG